MNPRSQDTYTQAYNKWVVDQTPENMAELVSVFMPTVNSELQQYKGSKDLLRTRAKSYVIQAIKSYNPLGNTKLNSWVVTNLKKLSRYGKRLHPIRESEDMIRNVAEFNRTVAELEDKLGRKPTDEELQDETGWSKKSIDKIRSALIKPVSAEETSFQDHEAGPSDLGVNRIDNTGFYADSVYNSLDRMDRDIFDYKLGTHGKKMLLGIDIAKKLGVTPAYISQRSAGIGNMLAGLGAK